MVARPRDIIYFISKLFESAVNHDHARVINDDFAYAVKEYSNFLHSHMISETQAQFPEIRNIFAEIIRSYNPIFCRGIRNPTWLFSPFHNFIALKKKSRTDQTAPDQSRHLLWSNRVSYYFFLTWFSTPLGQSYSGR